MTPRINEKLNAIFRCESERRKLVFWYDEHAEYAIEIETYTLENAEIIHLTDKNLIRTKHLIEREHPDTNYLIYAPFAQPPDSENPLADIVHYAETPFYADAASLLLQELGYPNDLKPTIVFYMKFWNSKERLEKYKALLIKDPSEKSIGLGILSVLTNTKHPKFEYVLEKVIFESAEENKYYTEFLKYGVDKVFWEFCEEEYGFRAENPTLQNLFRTLFVTDLYQNIQIPEKQRPAAWKQYTIQHPENVHNIIQGIRQNSTYKKTYAALAEKYERELNPVKNLDPELSADTYLGCDTFECFDRIITEYLKNYLIQNKEPYPEIYKKHRRETGSYFADSYKDAYSLLEMASGLIEKTNTAKQQIAKNGSDAASLLNAYENEFVYIDQFYRRFYEAYDNCPEKADYQELRDEIEGRYTTYLETINLQWTSLLEKTSIQKIPLPKQQNFYAKSVREESAKQRLVVIISDGLRYETALELNSRLNENQKYQGTLKPMLSTIPSKTELGMSALLPHETIEVITDNEQLGVKIDGAATADLIQRDAILKKYNENSVALTAATVDGKNRDYLRKVTENKNIIYVYHNRIDAIGDKAATESHVFSACRDTISEIESLINRLNHSLSISSYIITADHGFLYLRDKITESSKITIEKEEGDAIIKKRFIIGKQPNKTLGTLNIPLDYLGEKNKDLSVTVPKGIDLFKKAGNGLQYVHGGASLQEVIIPFLTLKTQRGKEDMEPAGLVLLSKPRITNMNEYIEFMQKYQVRDNVRPFEAKLYFIDSSGEKISNEVLIYADGRDDRLNFREKFTLRNKQYSRTDTYYLVIEDMTTNSEYRREKYTIDIAFRPIFG